MNSQAAARTTGDMPSPDEPALDEPAYLVLPPREHWRSAFADGYLRLLRLRDATRIHAEWRDRYGYASVIVRILPLEDAPERPEEAPRL